MSDQRIRVAPVSGTLGAEISGVDLSEISESSQTEPIRQALLDHGVIFFRNQKLTPDSVLAFARRFGRPEIHPIVEGTAEQPEIVRVLKPAGQSASFGVGWHSDNSFFESPSLGSVLYGVTLPPYGGDTLFASMERAYQALSEPMRVFLAGLRAVHSAARAYDPNRVGREKYDGDAPIKYRYTDAILEEVDHPVVRTHPETGRKSLYVNAMFTERILGMESGESDALLAFLYRHCAAPDFQCRFRWAPGSLAFWDNRCIQHYALDDYQSFERVMYRVTLAGDRPV